MIKLHARLSGRYDEEPFIARVVRDSAASEPDYEREVLYVSQGQLLIPGYRAYLLASGADAYGRTTDPKIWQIPESLHHLSSGDIIRISPRSGDLWVMYRRESAFNTMLLTERCNSYCIMCSQPPKPGEDGYLVRAYLDAIPLMAAETCELGITGGEPTLLGDGLLEIIRKCKDVLPGTGIHMLSNGRMFNYLTLCRALAAIEHPDLMIGIPLYSDIPHRHDYVVQADGSFDQTIRGIMNLARCGISVEIRMVLHQETIDRLPQFARFIARNLPFVDHVAFMGLEMMGFVRMNLDFLWVDPVDYQSQIKRAVIHLQWHGLNVSIYNHQLCVLDRQLWPLARKSISDWKNEYLDECNGCAVRDQCGGFFASSSVRHSDHIRRLHSEMLPTQSPSTATTPLTI
jgi:His-Xaa-Ser system radical SAM maturase HxsC